MERGNEISTGMSQQTIILEFMKGKVPQSIAEVERGTGILRPNIRRILGQGALKGTFRRVARGLYTLSTADGKATAYIDMGEAQFKVDEILKTGMAFDMVFLDCPYYSKALVGGNRGIKQYEFITPADFYQVCQAVRCLLRTDESRVYIMLSGAPTALPDMKRYLQMAEAAGLNLVSEGTYTKTFKDGTPVTNVRGVPAAPERLYLMTRSGSISGEATMHFRCIRPKGYSTEKAKYLLRVLIEEATVAGGWVLDLFGGSGVCGEQAILSGRNCYILDKAKEAVEGYILPRIKQAIKTYNTLNKG